MDVGRVLALLAGLAALFGGMAGWGMLLRKKAGLVADFVPAVVCGGFVCILYLGGLLGVLRPAALLAVGVGCLLLLWWLAGALRGKTLLADIKSLAAPGVIFFLVMAAVCWLADRGPMPMVGDAYNHWATMAKLMHVANRLPNAGDTVIVFQSYPPGSALFLYLVTTLTGFSEARLVWAHHLLMLAGMACLFGAVPKRRGVFPALTACLCVFLMVGQADVYDVLVDVLLAILAVAAACVILRYRRQPLRAALFALPLQTACLLTKNSGLFFVAANMALLVYFAIKNGRVQQPQGQKRRFARLAPLLLALLPFLALLLWNLHVDAAFPEGAVSIHAMRTGRLGENLARLSGQQLAQVAANLLKMTFSLGNGHFQALLFWNASLVALAIWWRRARPARAKALLKWLAFCDGVYLLYTAALYGTYVASMSYQEAVELASYGRYMGCVTIYMAGLLFWVLMEDWPALEKAGQRGALALALVLPLALGARSTVMLRRFERRPYEGTLYQVIDEQVDSLGLDAAGQSFYVVGPGEGIAGGTTGSYLKYKLFTMSTVVESAPESPAQLLQGMEGFHYLLVLEDSPAADELFSGYPRFAGDESYIGLYHLPLW